MFKDIFETKPDAINEKGTSFWLDIEITKYAKCLGLKEVKVLFLKDKNGYKTRIILEKEQYVYESQKLEDIGVHLDIMAKIREKK
jgi:hypothetical protein